MTRHVRRCVTRRQTRHTHTMMTRPVIDPVIREERRAAVVVGTAVVRNKICLVMQLCSTDLEQLIKFSITGMIMR